MPDLAAILHEFIVPMLPDREKIARLKIGLALNTLFILFALIGTIFAVIAVDRYLQNRYTPEVAALSVAALLFAVALLARISKYFILKKKVSPAKSAAPGAADGTYASIKGIFEELEEPIRENPKTALALAALAGMLLGKSRINL